jgi:hypothetical protein
VEIFIYGLVGGVMMDLTHKEEVEKLARTLKQNKVAQTESEAYRMAEDMLNTGRKVQEDFKARDKAIYGQEVRNQEVETAHKLMERISTNIAKGRQDVRIDIKELDLERPLKEMVPQEEHSPEKEDDDDAVLMKEDTPAPKEVSGAIEAVSASQSIAGSEVIQVDDDDNDDGNDDDNEEEQDLSGAVMLDTPEKKEEEDGDFSVKEL